MPVLRWGGWAALVVLTAHPLHAQVTFEAFSGTAWSLHSPLTITQSGKPDIHVTAHYATRPTEDTPYFGARFALWRGGAAWTLELIHHKLYLENPPPDVEYFKVTYGENMLTLGRAWRRGGFGYSMALGAVVTHASNSVRGLKYSGTGGLLNKGYTFSGVTGHVGLQYRAGLAGGLFLSVESLLSASYVRVHVADGDAQVPNAAVHLHAGLGYAF